MALVKCKSALLSLAKWTPLPSNPIQPLEVWQGRDKQTNEKVAVKFEVQMDCANVPNVSKCATLNRGPSRFTIGTRIHLDMRSNSSTSNMF